MTKRIVFFSLLLSLLLLASCTQKNEPLPVDGAIEKRPLSYSAPQSDTLLASLTAADTGISFQNSLSPANQFKYTYNGAGTAAADYDNDGLVDLFLVTEEGMSKLFRNKGNLQFEDSTVAAGLSDTTAEGGFSIGAAFADIDNDGDQDLFLTNWKVSNRLFQNNGDGTFTDITTSAGVTYVGGATTPTFADYDRDGDLDFFVATYRPHAIETEYDLAMLYDSNGNLIIPAGFEDRLKFMGPNNTGPIAEYGERDLLYRNNGDGTFSEVAAEAGIEGLYWGLSAAFADADNDGWPDLYITNDFWTPDQFYHNNGDGSFTLIGNNMYQHTPGFSMGVDFADINNDGLTDYFIGDMISRDHTKHLTQHGDMEMLPHQPGFAPQLMRNSLYVNNGDGSFTDIAWLADVAATEWTWTTKFADLDLDGFVDLLITNGMIRDWMDSDAAMTRPQDLPPMTEPETVAALLDHFPERNDPNMVFRNNGNLTFTETSDEWGFNAEAVGHGASLADLDNDGDLDVVVNFMNEQVGIYRNDSQNQRIAVQLKGNSSNKDGLGTKITLVTNLGTQTRFMSSSGGYLSSHQPLVVFGLADSATIQSMQIEWPSGHTQSFSAADQLTADTLYIISEPAGSATQSEAKPMFPENPQFIEIGGEAGINKFSEETFFNDFAMQPLLPRGLSTLGPGIAWGDADLDGDDDLYVAGPSRQTGSLYENQGNGRFIEKSSDSFDWRRTAEEMGVLWWPNPAENGRPNLIAAYNNLELGGDQLPAADLYSFTSSRGMAVEQSSWAPQTNQSMAALAAADLDQDGDLDLVIGGRSLPGHWPQAASSILYRNDNGTLVDVTAELAPGLQNLGMATGIVWADIDNDFDSDLLIATEYGPIHLFRNDNGRLTQATTEAALAAWPGAWTGIVTADFDGDGDLDLAAANLGLNTRYKASPEHPAVIYTTEMDGKTIIIEADYIGDTLYPIRERGMAGAQMPFILEKYPTFLSYAEASLTEIYGDQLDSMNRLEAKTFAHSIFLNDGNGRFSRTDLPIDAQVMAAYGIAVADLDNDGRDDLYMVGNFHHADMENMTYSGGTSYWLRGNGDGTFAAVSTADSGLFVPLEGRGVAISDFDKDGWADIAISTNNYRPLLFKNQGIAGRNSISVALNGSANNPNGVGARITVTLPDGRSSSREIQAGNGYLSQDSSRLIFGLNEASEATVTVVWPDGRSSSQTAAAGEALTISAP